MDQHGHPTTAPTSTPLQPRYTTPAYVKTFEIPPLNTLSGRGAACASFNACSPSRNRMAASGKDFRRQQVLHLLAPANEAMALPFHQHLRSAKTRIVIRTLRHSVGA